MALGIWQRTGLLRVFVRHVASLGPHCETMNRTASWLDEYADRTKAMMDDQRSREQSFVGRDDSLFKNYSEQLVTSVRIHLLTA